MSVVEVKQTRVALPSGMVLSVKEWYLPSAPRPSQSPIEIVLLHGLGDAACVWSAVAPELATRYRVVAIDLRGHGDSDWAADRDYSIEAYTGDIAALFEQLRVKDIVLVGHSLGGRVALHYAAQNVDRTKSIVFADFGPDVDKATSAYIRNSIRSAHRTYKRVEDYVAVLSERYLFCDDNLLHQVAVESTRRSTDRNFQLKYDPAVAGGEGLWKQPDHLSHGVEAWSLLSALQCEVIVMRGDISSLLSAAVAKRMVSGGMRNAQLITVPKAGHSIHLDNPTAVSKGMLRILACDSHKE